METKMKLFQHFYEPPRAPHLNVDRPPRCTQNWTPRPRGGDNIEFGGTGVPQSFKQVSFLFPSTVPKRPLLPEEKGAKMSLHAQQTFCPQRKRRNNMKGCGDFTIVQNNFIFVSIYGPQAPRVP